MYRCRKRNEDMLPVRQRAKQIFNSVATHLENLEKSGNLRVVRDK